MLNMNVAVDLDGTLLANAPLYREILLKWTGKRILLTARPLAEVLITIQELGEKGILQNFHYDELLMCPIPHIFDFDASGYDHKFWDDYGEVVFNDLKHRSDYLEWRKNHRIKPLMFDTEKFTETIANWKARVCKDYDVKVAFEDNPKNVEKMREAGVYVFEVDKNFGRN